MSETAALTDATRTVAALAACQLRGDHNDTALVLADESRICSDIEAIVAGVALIAKAWHIVAADAGRPPEEFAANISSTHADTVGADNPIALMCTAATMATGNRTDLEETVVSRAVTLHGSAAAAAATAAVLALAWRHQAQVSGTTPEAIAQAYCTVTASVA